MNLIALRAPLLIGLALIATAQMPPATRAADISPASITIASDDAAIHASGRRAQQGDALAIGYSGGRVQLRFEGRSIAVRLDDPSGQNFAQAWIDGRPQPKFRLDAPDGRYQLADGLSAGEHTVELVRLTEGFLGLIHFRGFEVGGEGAQALPWRAPNDRKIEFIGDSITCGYGVEVDDPQLHFEPATENFCEGYTGRAARQLQADYLVVARSGIGIFRNYDGPREGNPDAMPAVYPRLFFGDTTGEWDFSRFRPDVICVNLGTNDFSTSGVNEDAFVAAYIKFGSMLLQRQPQAKLVILQGPMNNSESLADALARVAEKLRESEPDRVHTFTLSPQGELGFGADYHPNRAQSARNAAELRGFLAKLMDWQ